MDREVKKAVVMRESGGDRTNHLLDFSTECFQKWSVVVVFVFVNLEVVSKNPMMPQLSHMLQLGCGNTSGGMPCGCNAFGGYAAENRPDHQMRYCHMAYLHWCCHNQAEA